jgi:hypothetical protein
MDKLTQYSHYVQELLSKYAAYSSSNQTVETQLVFDQQRHHYQLVYVG